MPFKRVKDGKVIEQRGTKQPTAEQAMARKQARIAEQNKQRAELSNESKATATDDSIAKESTKNKNAASE